MANKKASSEAAWALLTEGIAQARLDAHRLRHLVSRAESLVEGSPQREHLYQVAGDVILDVPERLRKLEVVLDRTLLAMSKMGEDFFSARLPLSEKNLVDEAIDPAFGGNKKIRQSAKRLARLWLTRRYQRESKPLKFGTKDA